MSFKDYQKVIDEWASQFETPYWKPHEITVRLMEEVGEFAREVNHLYGPKRKKTDENKRELSDEISDIFFTLMCFANSQGINLDEAFQRTIEKCYRRDNDRFEKK